MSITPTIETATQHVTYVWLCAKARPKDWLLSDEELEEASYEDRDDGGDGKDLSSMHGYNKYGDVIGVLAEAGLSLQRRLSEDEMLDRLDPLGIGKVIASIPSGMPGTEWRRSSLNVRENVAGTKVLHNMIDISISMRTKRGWRGIQQQPNPPISPKLINFATIAGLHLEFHHIRTYSMYSK